jgi:Dimerisation domain/O-methyltransferase domain
MAELLETKHQDVRFDGRTSTPVSSLQVPMEGATGSETADMILEIAYSFRAAKALMSAIELDLFTVLGNGAMGLEALTARLGIHQRGAHDFLDALVALKLLERSVDGLYCNTPAAALYLARGQPAYVGGIIEQLNGRLYGAWSRLTEALRTGLPQSEGLGAGGYAALYADKPVGNAFLHAMTGGALLPARCLASKFPWERHRHLIDIGTAEGCLPVEILRAHPHLTASGFDLPEV